MPDPNPTAFSQLSWTTRTVASEAASGTLGIQVGTVGRGRPRCVITCGMHGDEGAWGALAVRELLSLPVGAVRGTIEVVLAANPLAEQADARNAPLDTLDLNRTFPGNSEGSHTERLAAALAELTDNAELVIDLHGGGSWCVNAFVFAFQGCEALAELVGAPFLVHAPEKPGTFTRDAAAKGSRVLAVEMGGRSRDEQAWAARIAQGLTRVLKHEGVLDASVATREPSESVPVGPSHVLRPPSGGILMPAIREDRVGTIVDGGTLLGELLAMKTLRVLHEFRAPFPRTAILLLRPHVSVIEVGAMTYVVAEPQAT